MASSDSEIDFDLSDVESDFEDTSFSIGLGKTGEKGSGYHTRNDPNARFQRETVTERRGIIQVQCKSRDIIHGRFSDDGEQLGTLLVYDLHLDTTRRSRRIINASLEFEFESTTPGTPAPLVHAISPAGRNILLPTTQDESTVQGSEINAGVAQFGANVGDTLKWEKTVKKTTKDEIRVLGYIFSDDYGKGIGASWNLHENPSIKSGTPSFLRCAILLNRGDDSGEFQCKVKIKVEADWKSEMSHFFGSTPADDPILFDPELSPTNKLRKYDVENLSATDLDDISEIVFNKALKTKKGETA